LGAVMVGAFVHALRNSLAELHVDASVVHELESNATRLGGLSTPSTQNAETREQVQLAIAQAFVFGFRLIMLICAGLAITSAVVASRIIPSRGEQRAPDFGKVALGSETAGR